MRGHYTKRQNSTPAPCCGTCCLLEVDCHTFPQLELLDFDLSEYCCVKRSFAQRRAFGLARHRFHLIASAKPTFSGLTLRISKLSADRACVDGRRVGCGQRDPSLHTQFANTCAVVESAIPCRKKRRL